MQSLWSFLTSLVIDSNCYWVTIGSARSISSFWYLCILSWSSQPRISFASSLFLLTSLFKSSSIFSAEVFSWYFCFISIILCFVLKRFCSQYSKAFLYSCCFSMYFASCSCSFQSMEVAWSKSWKSLSLNILIFVINYSFSASSYEISFFNWWGVIDSDLSISTFWWAAVNSACKFL